MWGFSLARTQPHRLKPVLLGLVGRAFGHPDDVDAAVIGCAGLAAPVRVVTRDASMPFSPRYFTALVARSPAIFSGLASLGSE